MVKATTKHPNIEILRASGTKGITCLHQTFIINQSVFDQCQFLNPRNCPPQAPNIYVYAYLVHFEPTRGEGRHPITIGWGGRPMTYISISIFGGRLRYFGGRDVGWVGGGWRRGTYIFFPVTCYVTGGGVTAVTSR